MFSRFCNRLRSKPLTTCSKILRFHSSSVGDRPVIRPAPPPMVRVKTSPAILGGAAEGPGVAVPGEGEGEGVNWVGLRIRAMLGSLRSVMGWREG